MSKKPTLNELVAKGLDTVYEEIGKCYGDSEDIIDDIATAAEEWARECVVEASGGADYRRDR